MDKIRVLVAGCGNMGTAHARAYHKLEAFEIVGLVSRTKNSRENLSHELGGLPTFSDYASALQKTRPNAVSINTYPDTHAEYATMALNAGAHVFLEKPLATTVEEAQALVELAKSTQKQLIIGYILRVHPAWTAFMKAARGLGKPLVMRMNLNQQSSGSQWETHKNLMQSMSPIVDCGVHYVDIMCSMTQAKPISVYAIGARLSDEIAPHMYNYGQLQVKFEDGSVGWYEAGWGPMMSDTAYFVKDVIGPKGSVSIREINEGQSDEIEGHTQTGALKSHRSNLNSLGEFEMDDEWISTSDEPDHDTLCLMEQELFLSAIQGKADLSEHLQAAVDSLRIVLAADKSVKSGNVISL